MLEERQTDNQNPIWQAKLHVQRLVMFIASMAFTGAVFLPVVTRYLFNYSLFGIEEFASFAGIVMYFIGAAYATHERSHISASLVDTFFGQSRVTAVVHTFTRALSAALTIYLLVVFWDLLVFTERMNTKSTELRVPMLWIYGTMYAGLALMAFYFVLETYDSLRAAVSRQPRQETGA